MSGGLFSPANAVLDCSRELIYFANMESSVDTSNSEIRKAIFALALPIVWTNLLQRGVGIIDAVMVGHLGASELAAVGMSQLVVMFLIALPMGIGIGSMIMVANYTGENDHLRRSRAALTGMTMGLAVSALLSVICYFLSYHAARLLGADIPVASLSRQYLKIIAVFFSAKAAIYIVSYIFQGAGDSRTPLSVIVWVNVFHIALAYPLIYGLDIPALGITIPAWGIRGAAFATGITELGGALVLVRKGMKIGLLGKQLEKLSKTFIAKIIHLGTPVFFERMLTTSMQMVYARMVVGFSVAAYAAHQIGLNIESLSWLPGLAFGQTATAMVGQNIGARRPDSARRAGYQSTMVAVIFMTALGVSYLLFPRLWVRLFTSDPNVIAFGITYCYIVAFVQPPMASAIVLSGALRGAGNTRFVMGSTLIGGWLVRLPFAFITGIVLKGGIIWVWLAMILDWTVRTFILLWRYRREKLFGY